MSAKRQQEGAGAIRAVWRRSTTAATTIVLALGAIGLAYAGAFPRHWLRGVLVLAFAMVLGAVFRLILPARQAGMLAVRSRGMDVICYLGAGVAMAGLGLWLRSTGAT